MRNSSVTDEPNNLADQVETQVATDSEKSHSGVSGGGADGNLDESAAAGERPGAPDQPAGDDEMSSGDAAESRPADEELAAEEEAVDEIDEEISEEEPADTESDTLTPAEIAAALKQGEAEGEIQMDWYILKVQSNRERSIAEALERKIAIAGLSKYFGQVIVPTEKVTEFKGGKKKVVERKLYPGYIVVQMHINDDTWFAVRETSGVGDFTGAGGKPSPMLSHEVARIVQTDEEETDEAPKLDIRFAAGEKVKVKEGNFENFEGEVSSIDEASGRVTVMINIFGRSTPVELEYWQIEAM
jgi:transcription termination/antitermination protein NusG